MTKEIQFFGHLHMVSRYHFTFKETLEAIFGNSDSELEELGEEASGSESQRNKDVLFGQIRLSSWFTVRHRYEKQYLDMPVELKTYSHVQAWNNTYPKQINTCLALLYCNGALPKTSSGFCDFLISNVTQQVWTLLLFVKMYCVRPHTTIVQYRPQALQHYMCVSCM